MATINDCGFLDDALTTMVTTAALFPAPVEDGQDEDEVDEGDQDPVDELLESVQAGFTSMSLTALLVLRRQIFSEMEKAPTALPGLFGKDWSQAVLLSLDRRTMVLDLLRDNFHFQPTQKSSHFHGTGTIDDSGGGLGLQGAVGEGMEEQEEDLAVALEPVMQKIADRYNIPDEHVREFLAGGSVPPVGSIGSLNRVSGSASGGAPKGVAASRGTGEATVGDIRASVDPLFICLATLSDYLRDLFSSFLENNYFGHKFILLCLDYILQVPRLSCGQPRCPPAHLFSALLPLFLSCTHALA